FSRDWSSDVCSSDLKTKTHLLEFMETVTFLDEKFQGFDVIVGHSLGAVTTLNCLARGVRAQKAVAISSRDNMVDVLRDFVKKLRSEERRVGIECRCG